MAERSLGEITHPVSIVNVRFVSDENSTAMEKMAEELRTSAIVTDPLNPERNLSNREAIARQSEATRGTSAVWEGTFTYGPIITYSKKAF